MTTAPITNSAPASGSNELDPERSPQLRFATLQLDLSKVAKESAMAYIRELEKSQEEQKLVNKLYQEARQQQANAKSTKKATTMSIAMVNYMSKNDLAFDKTGNKIAAITTLLKKAFIPNAPASDTSESGIRHDKDEWEVAITSLKAHLDKLGTDTQQKMVFVQDFMGQYNSHLQGAHSAIQESNRTLSELGHTR